MRQSGKLADGDYWVICDRSGFKVPASETRMEWNGLRVWAKFWEPRDPADIPVKPRRDNRPIPNARTEPADYFLGENEATRDDL